jgi:hypothetical protein
VGLRLTPTGDSEEAAAAMTLAQKAINDAKAADDKAANARQMVLNDRERNASTIDELRAAAAQLPTTQQAANEIHMALQQQLDLTRDQVVALTEQLANIELTPGPQGATGPAGPTGATGDVGPTGQQGPTGATGLAGSKGDTGAAGPTGATGTQGVKGTTGTAGASGVAGPTGSTGTTGATGTANLTIGAAPVGLLALGGSTTVTVPLSRTMPSATYDVDFAHSAVVSLSNVTFTNVVKTTTSVTVRVTATGLALAAGTLIVVAR